MQRLRALDGLRALSILLVIVDHLLINRLIPGDGPWWRLDLGRVGVRVFFVISGFLITGLLMRELAETGRIRLGRFFFRRFMRIAPPAFALLGVVGVLAALGLSDAGPRAFVHAATYTSNYVAMPWDLAHTWSLSVEEQFYLFWPVALAAWGLGGGARLAAVFLVAAPVFRYVAASTPHWPYFYLFGFEANADALAAGCAVALLRDTAWRRPRWRSFLTGPVFWFAVAALALCWPLTALSPAREIWGITMANLAVALVLERCLRMPEGRATRLLDHPGLVRVGVLSYALYLCQQPLLAADRDLPLWLRLVLLAAAALALHRFVEQPALRLRQRLEHRFFGPGAAPSVHTPSPGAMAPP
jgi:peptidoglycan/LPS O-acetylase OafA/YrhL